jgi:hypothetical protein
VLDPIPGQNGLSIVKITDRQLAPLDEVKDQAQQLAQSSAGQAFGTWLQGARAKVQVSFLDPRYGTFDAAKFQIKPPTIDQTSGSSSSVSSSSSQNP